MAGTQQRYSPNTKSLRWPGGSLWNSSHARLLRYVVKLRSSAAPALALVRALCVDLLRVSSHRELPVCPSLARNVIATAPNPGRILALVGLGTVLARSWHWPPVAPTSGTIPTLARRHFCCLSAKHLRHGTRQHRCFLHALASGFIVPCAIPGLGCE